MLRVAHDALDLQEVGPRAVDPAQVERNPGRTDRGRPLLAERLRETNAPVLAEAA
jgi:hypothetical protein